MSTGATARAGARVRNVTTGEIGIVLGALQSGGLRVSVEIDREEWCGSIIGAPSRITAVWERWSVERI